MKALTSEELGVLIIIALLGIFIIFLEIRLLLHQREINKLKRRITELEGKQ